MDAARPNSVSKLMYDDVKGTVFEKYVAKPNSGSMHNFGAAVDIAIVDKNNEIIEMGLIPFYKSRTKIKLTYLWSKIKSKKLSKEAIKNRKLLKDVMLEAGFYPLSFEWWHFNGYKKSYIRKNYKMIN